MLTLAERTWVVFHYMLIYPIIPEGDYVWGGLLYLF